MSIYFFGPNNEAINWSQPADCSDITNLTVYAAFNHRFDTSFGDILSCWDYSTDKAWLLAKHSTSNQLFWEVAYNGGNSTDSIQDAAHSLVDGNWYRAVGRWEPTKIQTDLFDVSGATNFNKSAAISRTKVSQSAADIIASGQHNSLTSNNWDGNIAWATVWNVTLSDAEVAALMSGVNPWLMRNKDIKFCAPMFGKTFLTEWGPEHQLGTDNNTVNDSIIGHEPIGPWWVQPPAFEEEVETGGAVQSTSVAIFEALGGAGRVSVAGFEALGIADRLVVAPFEAPGVAERAVVALFEASGFAERADVASFESGGTLIVPAVAPFESLRVADRTDIAPLEALGVAERADVAPLEALGVADRTDVAQFESAGTLTAPAVAPFESLRVADRTDVAPLEALGVTDRTDVAPLEALGVADRTDVAQFESAGTLIVLAVAPFESLLTLAPVLVSPFEALVGIDRADVALLEALGLADRADVAQFESAGTLIVPVVVPFEAVGVAVRSDVSLFEALGGISRVDPAVFEALGIASRADLAQFEAAGKLVALTVAPFESPGFIGRTDVARFEALGAVDRADVTLFESLGIASRADLALFEARGRIARADLAPFESGGSIALLTLAPFESALHVEVASIAPFEARAGVISSLVIIPFEARGQAIASVIAPFEVFGFLSQFVTANGTIVSVFVEIGNPVVSLSTPSVVADITQVNGAENMPILLDNDNHVSLPAVRDRDGIFFTTGATITVALEKLDGTVVVAAKAMSFVVGSDGNFEALYDKSELPSSGGSAIDRATHYLHFVGSEGGKDFERFDKFFVKQRTT